MNTPNEPSFPVPSADAPRDAQRAYSRREVLEKSVLGLAVAGAAAAFLSACAGDAIERRPLASSTPARSYPRPTSFPGAAPAPVPMPPANVIPRTVWAKGSPITSRMNKADRPYSWITVHHDGMDAFTNTSYAAAASRLEQIRQSHLTRKPEAFGDIGYHYLIDPGGRVWQGRSIAWQGAHVAGENPGNLGICVMGNYEIQHPTPTQVAAINRFVASQMRTHSIPLARVRTHQEWPSASTKCPGFSLEQYMRLARLPGGPIAMA